MRLRSKCPVQIKNQPEPLLLHLKKLKKKKRSKYLCRQEAINNSFRCLILTHCLFQIILFFMPKYIVNILKNKIKKKNKRQQKQAEKVLC